MPLPDALPAYVMPHLAADFSSPAEGSPAPKPLLVTVQPRCAAAQADEIMVCATDPERNRLRPLPDMPQTGLPRAAARIDDDVVIDIHNAQAMVGGWPSNRMMIGLTFGL